MITHSTSDWFRKVGRIIAVGVWIGLWIGSGDIVEFGCEVVVGVIGCELEEINGIGLVIAQVEYRVGVFSSELSAFVYNTSS